MVCDKEILEQKSLDMHIIPQIFFCYKTYDYQYYSVNILQFINISMYPRITRVNWAWFDSKTLISFINQIKINSKFRTETRKQISCLRGKKVDSFNVFFWDSRKMISINFHAKWGKHFFEILHLSWRFARKEDKHQRKTFPGIQF